MRPALLLSEELSNPKYLKQCHRKPNQAEDIRTLLFTRTAICSLKGAPRFGPIHGRSIAPAIVDPSTLEENRARRLLLSFCGGDSDAFWELWDLYKAHLYHLCLWQMGGVREDAEDALSRAMLRALDKLPGNYRDIQNIRAWLSKLTLNMCIDMHRERRRQVRRLESIEDSHLDNAAVAVASSDSPEQGLLNREVFDYMCEAVADLPPRLREPFVLRFFQEMAYPDIAKSLILTPDNVRKRIQQARDILKQRLKRVRENGSKTTARGRKVSLSQPGLALQSAVEDRVEGRGLYSLRSHDGVATARRTRPVVDAAH